MTADQGQQTADANGAATTEADGRVYEPPSFDDLKWPPERVYTYAQLYEKLVRQLSHEEAWGRVWRFLLFMLFSISLVFILPNSSPAERLYNTWSFIIIFFFASLVVAVVFIAWLLNQNTFVAEAEIAAKLIVVTRSPRTGGQGLGPLDLRRLERSALVVQQAADWRGSIVTTLIITIVLTSFIAAARFLDLDYFAGVVAGQPAPTAAYRAIATAVNYLVLLAIPAYVALSLFQYFRRFVSHEKANRLILLAIADAFSALEDCGLATRNSLTFREKRIAIKRLGYQLSPEPLSHRLSDEMSMFEYGLAPGPAANWYLEPLAPKTQPYLIEFLLLPLYFLAMMPVWFDNVGYSLFLQTRANVRRRTTELFGQEVTWPAGKRNNDDR